MIRPGAQIAALLSAGAVVAVVGTRDWGPAPAISGSRPAGVAATSPKGTVDLNRIETRQLSMFSETLARPIFIEGRRPPAAPAPPKTAEPVAMAPRQPPKPEEPIVTLRLIGVQIDGSSRRALIATSSGSRVWVDERGAVAGWTVESITANEVTVKGRGGRNILALYRASEGKR